MRWDTSDESDEEVTGAEAAPAPAGTFKSWNIQIQETANGCVL